LPHHADGCHVTTHVAFYVTQRQTCRYSSGKSQVRLFLLGELRLLSHETAVLEVGLPGELGQVRHVDECRLLNVKGLFAGISRLISKSNADPGGLFGGEFPGDGLAKTANWTLRAREM